MMGEMIEMFDLEKVNKAGAVFDVSKLNWMNGMYLRQMPIGELTEQRMPRLAGAGNASLDFLAAVPDEVRVGAIAYSTVPHPLDGPGTDREEVVELMENLTADGGTATGEALAEVIRRVAALAEIAPEIAELGLNPVIVLPRGEGAVVADARVRLCD